MITRNTHRHDRQALIFIKDPPLFLVCRGGKSAEVFLVGEGGGISRCLRIINGARGDYRKWTTKEGS